MSSARTERKQAQRAARRALIISAVGELARPLILERFGVSSCIASTAIGIDALAAFGIAATPLSVRAQIFNPPLAARMRAGEQFPSDSEAIDRLFAVDGSWSVGVGFGDRIDPSRWPGHLVAWIRSERGFLDLSIDQADRPEKQIKLLPGAYQASAAFARGEEPAVYTINDCVLIYTAMPDDRSFAVAPDWHDRARRRDLVGRLVEQVRRGVA